MNYIYPKYVVISENSFLNRSKGLTIPLYKIII